tara:strand:- start:5323 stop:5568 length:246 start_codon:yes stop_codon:yes gene_type:complete
MYSCLWTFPWIPNRGSAGFAQVLNIIVADSPFRDPIVARRCVPKAAGYRESLPLGVYGARENRYCKNRGTPVQNGYGREDR